MLEHADNRCNTPDNKAGSCKSLTACHELREKLTAREITRSFLRDSQCRNGANLFCCPNLEISVGWLENLKSKVPEPPHCGQGLQDRIIGGSETEINEYPWTVLLDYEKRKTVCVLLVLNLFNEAS